MPQNNEACTLHMPQNNLLIIQFAGKSKIAMKNNQYILSEFDLESNQGISPNLKIALALSFGSILHISFLINDVTKLSSCAPAMRTTAAAKR